MTVSAIVCGLWVEITYMPKAVLTQYSVNLAYSLAENY